MNKIILDEGYFFGLGLFETMLVENKKVYFLQEHIERINTSIKALNLNIKEIDEAEIIGYIEQNKSYFEKGKLVLKVNLSEQNRIFTTRNFAYDDEIYKIGFRLCLADIRRNKFSPFTYHKCNNYADNIFENRKAKSLGFDEAIFLNHDDEICEGSISNIFFVKDDKLYTPKVESGLLKGIIREQIIKKFDVEEAIIRLTDISQFSSCFITNSIIGIMPVNSIGKQRFTINSKYQKEYIFI